MKFAIRSVCLLIFVGLILAAQPPSAQAVANCIQDVWTAHGNSQNLTCTANDVTISTITNIGISAGGKCDANGCVCFQGGNVTFAADFSMPLTAQERYDIGFYIATDGDQTAKGALTGQCASTNVTSANALGTFVNDDPSPDVCGDIKGNLGSAYNPQIVRFELTVPCNPDANGKLALPYCTTWRQPGSNQVCLGTGDSPATNDVYPGSPSKCFCGIKEIDIFTETASIELTKACTSGTIPEIGGSTTYTVTVKNLAQVAVVTLASLTDSIYGDITQEAGDITDTTCSLVDIPAGNVTGNPFTCTFTATAPAGNAGGKLTYTDVQEPPTLVKDVAACGSVQFSMDVTYTVLVTNTSPTPPGDTLTLSSLTDDKFGDITTAHAAGGGYEEVVSTNCGLDKASDGPGTLPAVIQPGGNYTCQFTGKVTSSPHTNTATGSSTDDDGVSYSPSDDATVGVTVNTSGCP